MPEKEKSGATPVEPLLIKPSKVAEMIGISLPTLRKWVRDGIVNGIVIGSRLYFRKADVDEAIERLSKHDPKKEG